MNLTDGQRASRAQAMCEQTIWTGPRQGESCGLRAKWMRRTSALIDAGHRVCGVHARAYTQASLVEIGSDGWATA